MFLFLQSAGQRITSLWESCSPQQKIVLGFLFYIVLGTVFLCLPISQRQPASVIDHLFTATSAVSTTGLLTVDPSTTYTFFGQLVVLLLIQIGGIGYLTFTSFVLLSAKHTISKNRSAILQAEFAVPNGFDMPVFLKSIVFYTLFVELAGAVVLSGLFYYLGADLGFALWSGVFHSASAFCTAGISLYPTSLIGFIQAPFVTEVITLLSVLGAFGFIPITDLIKTMSGEQNKLSYTTLVIFWVFVLLTSFGALVLLFTDPGLQTLPIETRLTAAYAQAISAASTAGFNNINTQSLPMPSLVVLILLMFVGAAPSGTGGGIKNTTFAAILAMVLAKLRGHREIRLGNKVLPFRRIYAAAATVTFYSGILFCLVFLLSFFESFPLADLLFEATSALGTVGLSTGITGQLTSIGKIILVAGMFMGRLGVITFGLAFFLQQKEERTDPAKRVDIAV